MQIIPQPLPSINLRRVQPRLPIRQRQEIPPPANHNGHDRRRGAPERHERIPTHALPSRKVSFREAWRYGLFDIAIFFAALPIGGGEGGDRVVQSDGVDVADELEKGTGDEGGGEVCGEVVVQEELAAHEVEGEVVRGPAEEEEARGIV